MHLPGLRRPGLALLPAFLLLVATTQPLRAQADSATVARDLARGEVLGYLQWRDSAAFFDEARVDSIARVLAAIRARFPDVGPVSRPGWIPVLVLRPPRDEPRLFVRRSGARNPDPAAGYWAVAVPRVGVPEIDRLNAQLGVDTVRVHSDGRVVLQFRGLPNLRVLGERYAALPTVSHAYQPFTLDQASWVEFVEDGPVMNVVFTHGYERCTRGCREIRRYHIAFDTRTGRAERVSAAVGTTWDVPSQRSPATTLRVPLIRPPRLRRPTAPA